MPWIKALSLCAMHWFNRTMRRFYAFPGSVHWLHRCAVPFVFWLIAVCLSAGAAQASPFVLKLQDGAAPVAGWPSTELLVDASRQWSLSDVLKQTQNFHRPEGSSTSLGMRSEAVWLRIPFSVDSASDGQWIVSIHHADLQHVDFYLTAQGAVLQHENLGSLQQASSSALEGRSHALALKVQAHHAYELYVRVQTQGALIVPITFHKPASLLQYAVNNQMVQGVQIGLGLCLILYSLAQWTSLRERLFLFYALMTCGSLLFSLHWFGIGRQYLWGLSPWVELHIAALAALLATCGSFLFIGHVLAGQRPDSRFLRRMRYGAALCVALAVAYITGLLPTSAISAIVSILGLVPALMGIPGAARRAMQRDSLGISLLLAWLIYFIATATVIGVINGLLPVNFWTMHSFQFGATLDMLLFLRVLGLRTKALHTAALVASRERDAMHSLAHTDPLTGTLNRRGLNMAMEQALSQSTPQELVAVYMMDLDGFKPINDQHGHDVGDSLLIAVTKRLKGKLRHNDTVARLGGDEFVVMVERLADPLLAHQLGQQLLAAFEEPFDIGRVQVQVGLTIGYAIAPLDSTHAAALLKLADAAMYSGKQSGKFCVRRNTGDLALSSN